MSHLSLLFPLALLLAAICPHAVGPASANTICTETSQGFFERDIDLCFNNAQRIDCRTYCSHLPSRITEMAGGLQAIEEFRPQEHAEWQQCYQDHQLPCENRRDQELNDCLIDAQATFHARWLACPEAGTSVPPLPPNRLFEN